MSDNAPNYDKIITIEEVESEIQKHKDLVCRKAKERGQIRENRKEAMKAYNDELKICEEELDFNLGVLDELNRHKKLVLAGAVGPKKSLQSV